MRWTLSLTLALALMSSSALADRASHRNRSAAAEVANTVRSGMARATDLRGAIVRVSWYGLRDGSGSRTAEGRVFNPYALGLAAPPHYPFGTRLRLTVVETGQSVVATVSDRNGPGVARGGRTFDLYYGTARALGIVQQGTALVRVELAQYAEEKASVEMAALPPAAASVRAMWSRIRH